MAFSRRHLILTLFALCGSGLRPLAAQAPTEPPPSFRLLSLGNAEPLRYDLDRKNTRIVNLTTTTYSRPQPLPANHQLQFYRLGESTVPNQPPPRLPVAEISIPHDAPMPVVVILIPGGLPGRPLPILSNGETAEFSALILDDSETAAPRDHLRIISFSQRPAAVKLGEQGVQLAPFETQSIPYPTGSRTALQVATLYHQAWAPVISSMQMLAADTRITLLLSDAPPGPSGTPPADLRLRKVVEVL